MLEATATELPRLMRCNGSASMAKFDGAIDANHSVRDEGIAAHYLAVQIMQSGLDENSLIGTQAPNGIFITEEMFAHIIDYLDLINGWGPDILFSEMECDTSHQNGSFYSVKGRADNVTLTADNWLMIDDFKYGYRIVEPENNWTLISHAIGFCASRIGQPLPEKFVFTVVQPRAAHNDGPVRQWSIDQTEFMSFWQKLADTLSNLNDELNTGNHCAKCPSLHYCPAATKAGLNAIEVAENAFNENLTNDELSLFMDLLNNAIATAKSKLDAMQELALHRIKSGQVVKNYMPENSLGNTTWKGFVKPDLIKVMTGVDVTSGKMITPNQAKKLGVPPEIVAMLTERPNRGTKLKRSTANEKATKMFANVKGNEHAN